MPFSEAEKTNIESAMEVFFERRRPREEVRDKLDLAYRIEDQSVVIYLIWPIRDKPGKIREEMIAKATYVKSRMKWKVYWMRADMKWHLYSPEPEVKTFPDFLILVDEDANHCFWG